ncbi:Urease accessory protein UreD [Mycolicibacterium vanbaalenii]|uniref:Urease accessory protein UreD n=1 Tax=Mycolicibacterium vanbaalenii TaxID=110539 RepID=A0A5S9R5H2_MYCVN|nr:urease accessory protein UreD [Mycolicibacterium vanbaalenii]CAA0129250.1 Urease accessory protein UreD [Mycolicibacterium vanbaalenii]
MTAPAISPGELGIDVVADTTGRTRTASLRQRYPQRVTMAMHSDPEHPGAASLCVQSPSGGAFSDDELHTSVRCHPGTHLHLTTQAATQVFAGDGPGARHRLAFTVHAGAVLEYYPGTVIPHADSSFLQRLDVDVEPGGTYLGWEAVAAGRIAHGERFGYVCYDSAIVVRVAGHAVARDRQVLRPRVGKCPTEDDYLATFVAVTPGRVVDPLLERVRLILDNLDRCSGGAGRLPGAAGLFVRLTAGSAPDLHRTRGYLFDAARTEVLTRAGAT